MNNRQNKIETNHVRRDPSLSRHRYIASMKLDGIELSEKTLAMFDLFDEKQFTPEQQIHFIKQFYGYE